MTLQDAISVAGEGGRANVAYLRPCRYEVHLSSKWSSLFLAASHREVGVIPTVISGNHAGETRCTTAAAAADNAEQSKQEENVPTSCLVDSIQW